MSDFALEQILWASRSRNEAAGVTGLLLFRHGHFVQVLEGESNAVEPIFAAIVRDTRHHAIQTVLDSRIDARRYPDWHMAFLRVSDEKMSAAIAGQGSSAQTAGLFERSNRMLLTEYAESLLGYFTPG